MVSRRLELPRVSARDDARPGRRAFAARRVGLREEDSLAGNAIQRRRLNPCASIGTRVAIRPVIRHRKQDIGLGRTPRRLGGCQRRWQREQEDSQSDESHWMTHIHVRCLHLSKSVSSSSLPASFLRRRAHVRDPADRLPHSSVRIAWQNTMDEALQPARCQTSFMSAPGRELHLRMTSWLFTPRIYLWAPCPSTHYRCNHSTKPARQHPYT